MEKYAVVNDPKEKTAKAKAKKDIKKSKKSKKKEKHGEAKVAG